MTPDESVRKWVGEFNEIPIALITRAYGIDYDDFKRLTEFDDEDEMNDYLPMWGTMWCFSDRSDEEWLAENIAAAKECGIIVYESEELGYCFGIDGAGYSFFEKHWKPFYLARGLKWHDET